MTQQKHIPLGVGFYPDWWFKNNSISAEKRSEMARDLSQVFSFVIENSDYENPDSEINVVISKILLKKDLSLFNRTALISFLFYIFQMLWGDIY